MADFRREIEGPLSTLPSKQGLKLAMAHESSDLEDPLSTLPSKQGLKQDYEVTTQTNLWDPLSTLPSKQGLKP